MSGNHLVLRPAAEDDARIIFEFINELAAYEKMADDMVGTVEDIVETVFKQKKAHVLIAMWDGEAVGFTLYFYSYSTFLCRPCIYIEDVYVKPHARGKGIGTTIFKTLAKKAVDENCGRLEWVCLDWNKPSLDFYKNLGADIAPGWLRHRAEGESLKKMAE